MLHNSLILSSSLCFIIAGFGIPICGPQLILMSSPKHWDWWMAVFFILLWCAGLSYSVNYFVGN